MSATPQLHCNSDGPSLYLAFELGHSKWKLALTIGLGQKPRLRDIKAADVVSLAREIERAKKRFGLPLEARVRSCYEAGRDGFWLHRYLTNQGIENMIVDSASIEVNRRKRRAKNDRLDVQKLLTMLQRYHLGEVKIWSIVQPPNVEQEDERQLDRELMALMCERTKHINRIKGLLAGWGIRITSLSQTFWRRLDELRLWWDVSQNPEGAELPARLRQRLLREFERMALLERQIREVTKERAQRIGQSETPQAEQMRKLLCFRGIGAGTASVYITEFFGWRQFKNRRQVGSLAGLTPTPYDSGNANHEQGISKAGNRRIRTLSVESAWNWLRFQPQSELSRWYRRRFGSATKRQRRIGIVAMARKLLTQLFQYLQTGVPPAGAIMVPWQSKLPRSAIREA